MEYWQAAATTTAAEDWNDTSFDTRWLAGKDDGDKPKRSDYSILSIAVITLGLILLVELGRHRLDHSALGRPFFQSVLEGVYRECTYGIMWLCVVLLLLIIVLTHSPTHPPTPFSIHTRTG